MCDYLAIPGGQRLVLSNCLLGITIMKTISLKIPESLERRLQQCAEAAGMSKSELLRQALEGYLSKGKLANSASVTFLADDLVGCFRGPADLSTNADHLNDYGK